MNITKEITNATAVETKTLSDAIFQPKDMTELIRVNDVKEFIKDILEDCCTLCEDDIKKRVGPKLT